MGGGGGGGGGGLVQGGGGTVHSKHIAKSSKRWERLNFVKSSTFSIFEKVYFITN